MPWWQTSQIDGGYNCVAWALHFSKDTFWPEPYHYWPLTYPAVVDVKAFADGFACYGFQPCNGSQLERGFEKIALYTRNGEPMHVARQRPDGTWTSKLGPKIDIGHHGLHEFPPELHVAALYGSATHFFRRSHARARIDFIGRVIWIAQRRIMQKF